MLLENYSVIIREAAIMYQTHCNEVFMGENCATVQSMSGISEHLTHGT
jgi:hypothetical protein